MECTHTPDRTRAEARTSHAHSRTCTCLVSADTPGATPARRHATMHRNCARARACQSRKSAHARANTSSAYPRCDGSSILVDQMRRLTVEHGHTSRSHSNTPQPTAHLNNVMCPNICNSTLRSAAAPSSSTGALTARISTVHRSHMPHTIRTCSFEYWQQYWHNGFGNAIHRVSLLHANPSTTSGTLAPTCFSGDL
jgi:hypothetical protein